jgi:hypothetical protein|tara:strand:- start:350 stop:505 length:156 start_codon:yes stop_codon:yes gene_type:complete
MGDDAARCGTYTTFFNFAPARVFALESSRLAHRRLQLVRQEQPFLLIDISS